MNLLFSSSKQPLQTYWALKESSTKWDLPIQLAYQKIGIEFLDLEMSAPFCQWGMDFGNLKWDRHLNRRKQKNETCLNYLQPELGNKQRVPSSRIVMCRDRKYDNFFSTAASIPRSRASKLFSPDFVFAASLHSENLAQARERKIKRAAAITPKEFTIFRFRI